MTTAPTIHDHAELARLREWVAGREDHAAASDLNRDEERGWNLALTGVEYRLQKILGER